MWSRSGYLSMMHGNQRMAYVHMPVVVEDDGTYAGWLLHGAHKLINVAVVWCLALFHDQHGAPRATWPAGLVSQQLYANTASCQLGTLDVQR